MKNSTSERAVLETLNGPGASERPDDQPCDTEDCDGIIQPLKTRNGWRLFGKYCDACTEEFRRRQLAPTLQHRIAVALRAAEIPQTYWGLSLAPQDLVRGRPEEANDPRAFRDRCRAAGKLGLVQGNKELLAFLRGWRLRPATRTATGTPEWVYAVGKVGSGKTSLCAAALVRALADYHYTAGEMGAASGLYIRESALWTLSIQARGDLVRRAGRVGLLLFDDLGTTQAPRPWQADVIEALLCERYDRRLPTLITSNDPPEHHEDAIGARVLSRLGEALAGTDRLFEVGGVDWRRGVRI